MKESKNENNAADSSAESSDLLGRLDVAYDLANHGIPFYAYGDNEAACDMASRLEQIVRELRCVRALINAFREGAA